jgi:hypothetical protein
MSLQLKAYLDYIERCNAEPRDKSSNTPGEDDLFLAALNYNQLLLDRLASRTYFILEAL